MLIEQTANPAWEFTQVLLGVGGGNNQIDHSRAGGKSELGGKLKARGEEGQGQGMPCRRNGVSAVWSGSPQLGEHV